MPEFVLDTSGEVDAARKWQTGMVREGFRGMMRWQDLDVFTQGYIEAMLASVRGFHEPYYLKWDERTGYRGVRPLAFRDLAPETLARIIDDCDWLCTDASIRRISRDLGREIWAERQAGNVAHVAPLKPYLGDDGKVYLG